MFPIQILHCGKPTPAPNLPCMSAQQVTFMRLQSRSGMAFWRERRLILFARRTTKNAWLSDAQRELPLLWFFFKIWANFKCNQNWKTRIKRAHLDHTPTYGRFTHCLKAKKRFVFVQPPRSLCSGLIFSFSKIQHPEIPIAWNSSNSRLQSPCHTNGHRRTRIAQKWVVTTWPFRRSMPSTLLFLGSKSVIFP